MRRSRTAPLVALAVLAVLVVLVAACSSGTGAPGSSPDWTVAPPSPGASAARATPSVIPVIIGQQVKGPYRFVFSLLDATTNLPAASPDRTVSVAFVPPGASDPGTAVKADFIWAIEGSRGEYVAYTEFPQAGDWKAIFVTEAQGAAQEAIGVAFQVQDDLPVIAVGEKAPPSDTPTAADVGGDLKQLSTDTNPDPLFYELSVADAVAQGKPFVLAFTTPAFCQSAQCGPTLDLVKQVSASSPQDVSFINVEPYQLSFTEGRLQPILDADGQLQPVPAVDEWGILSEPWLFAVDGEGIVRRSFEGAVSEAELRDAIAEIAGT